MNRRRTTIILCALLPLFFLGCQTYTASKGKAEIEPTPSVSGKQIITKYSVLQEGQEALLREKALKERQAEASLAERLQAEKDEMLASLTGREQELERLVWELESRLKKTTEEKQQLVDNLTAVTLENEKLALGKRLSSQEAAERIVELQGENAQLADKILELQSQIEEYKILQEEQKAERLSLEQEKVTLAAEILTIKAQSEEDVLAIEEKNRLEQARIASQEEAKLLALEDEKDTLASEIRMLKAQLEEKTLTIEEKNRLEQARFEEAKRLEQEKLAKRLEQEAEKARLSSAEEAKRIAMEKEWRQIPPLDQITYPRLYKTEKPISLAKEAEKLRALMLPLDDVPWKDSKTVLEVQKSISDLEVPIIFVTGHMENVIALVREMRSNAALFSTGAIITSFPILDLSNYSVEIQYQEKKTLRLCIANLPEYQVVQQFIANGAWQTTQKSLTENRLAHLRQMLGEGSLTVPTLLGASLYEPSYRDWNTFSPVTYRQIDYLWPLSSFLENEGFYDTYRLTHFSEATNAGNTLGTPNWNERVDFIYSRKILPLESTMLTIGGESAPDESGISRFGVLGTFLVP